MLGVKSPEIPKVTVSSATQQHKMRREILQEYSFYGKDYT